MSPFNMRYDNVVWTYTCPTHKHSSWCVYIIGSVHATYPHTCTCIYVVYGVRGLNMLLGCNWVNPFLFSVPYAIYLLVCYFIHIFSCPRLLSIPCIPPTVMIDGNIHYIAPPPSTHDMVHSLSHIIGPTTSHHLTLYS